MYLSAQRNTIKLSHGRACARAHKISHSVMTESTETPLQSQLVFGDNSIELPPDTSPPLSIQMPQTLQRCGHGAYLQTLMSIQ